MSIVSEFHSIVIAACFASKSALEAFLIRNTGFAAKQEIVVAAAHTIIVIKRRDS